MSDDESSSESVPEEVTRQDLRDLIEAQKQEVELEREKQETRRQELEYEERQAKRALEAQLEDRKRAREYQQEENQRQERYGLLIFAAAFAFLGWLAYLGYTDMVFEIIRIVVYGGAGWTAGQSVGKANVQQTRNQGTE